ncbi:hypothetical protein HHK36_031972 [Tetracentron sinense]|uniref:Uncharacterized protein n=1 Tax=Tetracentron sinense TaxID=13715 RepID=A0A834Y831_TETSI|nr:hypothetical protein HHK36_031972 [Tetracentron sinense]
MSSTAGPSHLPSSDSEDEYISLPPSPNYITEMAKWEEEQSLLIRLYTSNNAFITQSLEEDDEPKCRGSVPGHIVLNRGRKEGHIQLWNDYFSKNPTFGESLFRRRFRMRRSLFLRIVNALKDHDNYFMQKKDSLDRLRLSTLQKVTAVFRILANGASADSTDEYTRISESTAILCSNNDINVLQSSNLFANLTQGIAPLAYYTIQGTEYNVGYYLADCIYPKWSTLVQTISQPQGRKKQYFAMMQEAYRKDVEQAFGVLQLRLAIVK